jgi:hypothetical protein
MSELTSYYYYEDRVITPSTHQYRVYHADEADNVIADLEESHKMEVEQLLILNREQANAANRLRDSMEKSIRHSNYKRCLAMSQEWRNYAAFCGMQSSCHNHRGFGKTAEKWSWRETHAWRCVNRWIKLAIKFKPN